jgi:TRAP-type C4-dicarboxylate transport system permease small subunit
MKRLLEICRTIIKDVLILLSMAMCVVVFWQVISRFIIKNPSRWSEEVARYLMIWITFLAASVGVTQRNHLGLNIVVDSIKNAKVHYFFIILQHVCLIAFSLVLLIYGLQYTIEGSRQTGMSIMLKMSYVYSVIPISGFFMVINSIENIVQDVKAHRLAKEGESK